MRDECARDKQLFSPGVSLEKPQRLCGFSLEEKVEGESAALASESKLQFLHPKDAYL